MEKNQLLIAIIANSVEKFLNKQKSKKNVQKNEDFNQCPKSQFEECDKQSHS